MFVHCFKTQHLRTGLWAPELCLDTSSSHWCSDINDLTLTGKSPSDICFVATVFKGGDVILSISKFLFSLLVPLVLTNLRNCLPPQWLHAVFNLWGPLELPIFLGIDVVDNMVNNLTVHQYPLCFCPRKFGIYGFLLALVTCLENCDRKCKLWPGFWKLHLSVFFSEDNLE